MATTTYDWRKKGTNGAGRTNMGAADTLNPNHVGLMGDVWGAHTTYNNGDEWFSRQWGVTPHSAAVSGDAYGRACEFSKRPSTSGVMYTGTGTLTGGGGHFGAIPDQSFQQIPIDTVNKFGTSYASGVSNNYPRPCGNCILVDYDSVNDIEYVITYNNFGVNVYKNGGGKNILAAQAPTQLVSSAVVNGPRYKTAALIDAQHAFFGSYQYTLANVQSTSNLVLMSTTSARLGIANNSTVTVTDVSSHIPGTQRLNWIENLGGTIYAACDDGVYSVNSAGTTWTSLGFLTNGGNPLCVKWSATTSTLYVFCGKDPTANHRVVAKGVFSSGSWHWTWLVTGSNLSAIECGSGNTWWLAGGFPDLNSSAFGCLAGAVQNVSGTDYIYVFGSGGINTSRDGGNTWAPCPVGAGGGECNGMVAGTGGTCTIQDHDYGTVTTNNHWTTAVKGGTATSATGLTVTKNGHTFTVGVAGTPATCMLDSVDVSTDYFRGACISPNAVDISSETPPYLYIGMVGGDALVGTPIVNPAKPVAGTPSLSNDNPVQGTSLSVNVNAASWLGNPAPIFTYQWQSAASPISTFTNEAGATGSTYDPVLADVGNVLRCQITATNTGGSALANTEISNIVAPKGGGPDTTPPTAPSSISATPASDVEIDLSWGASIDTGGSGLGGYTINRTTGVTPVTVTAGTVGPNVDAFQDVGLLPNTVYSYVVTAFDNAGNTTGSSTVTATTLPAHTGGDQSVTINQPQPNQVFTSQQITVTAVVVPGTFPIEKVTLTINSGVELQMALNTQITNTWTKNIALTIGSNIIQVLSYDSSNFIVTSTVNVSFSTTDAGPVITILEPTPDGVVLTSNTVVVQADIEDLTGIDSTTVLVSTDGINWQPMTPPSTMSNESDD